MNWTLPGTVLTANREDVQFIENQFASMFFGGGMVLSQVAGITGLEPYTVQNWVKRELLPPPDHKRYNLNQLCRIININMLKNVLPMERICGLLTYINGDLDDASDDIIDDAKLYFMFVKLAAGFSNMHNPTGRDAAIDVVLSDYAEPVPGAKARVEKVLRIMLTAWAAAQLQQNAEKMLQEL
jgi:DNA-binding transcriptional MerR regulator